ncbi:DUF2946 family protein [Xanthobacter sp. VNH20]|uniref:DUF2946 family protein n=1 Tax=Xanthobacter TaxID=279 RepID=UPI0032B3529E
MIRRLGQGWGGVRAVAWTVVYALVLQIVLTSAFIASRTLDAAQDPYQLCLNVPSDYAPQGGDTDDRGTAAFVHCPLCLSRVDVAILPTPPAIPAIERLAVAFRFHLPESSTPVVSDERVAHRPRGPPIPA